MSSEPPALPSLHPPPRAIPLGVRLRVLDHHSVSGTLWFTLPAAAILLFGLIADLPRVARPAPIIFGACLLLVAVRSGLPPLRRGLRRVHRLENGLVTMGRIVSCRVEGQDAQAARPYAEFLRKYGSIAGAHMLEMAGGCALGLIGLPIAVITSLLILSFVISSIARLFNPALDFGDMDFDNFLRFSLAFMGFLAFVLVLLATWRKTSVPMVGAYLRHEMKQAMANAPEIHRKKMQAEMEAAAKAGLEYLLPARSDHGIRLTCDVEYLAMGEPRIATGAAVLGNHLNLAGIEPILFDPLNPGEVDLFAGFSSRVQVKDGRWQPIPWLGSAVSLSVAGAVMAFDVLLLIASAGRSGL